MREKANQESIVASQKLANAERAEKIAIEERERAEKLSQDSVKALAEAE